MTKILKITLLFILITGCKETQNNYFRLPNQTEVAFAMNKKMNSSDLLSAEMAENESVRVMQELGTSDRGWDLVTTISYLVMSLSESKKKLEIYMKLKC